MTAYVDRGTFCVFLEDAFHEGHFRQFDIEAADHSQYLTYLGDHVLAPTNGVVVWFVEIISCSIQKLHKAVRSKLGNYVISVLFGDVQLVVLHEGRPEQRHQLINLIQVWINLIRIILRSARSLFRGMEKVWKLDYILVYLGMHSIDKGQLSSWVRLTEDFYLDPDGLLGKGCFGEVFRGYSMKREKLVAIKTMQGEGYQREVETLMALSSLSHPSIMGYYGYEKIKDSVYIFVEFCPNGTLTDLINQGIPEEKALQLFRQIVEGMCYMNAKGKMHRDLKPDNILIGLDMDVKISDFGLARETTGIFVTGQMGTPLYAGPEVYLNKYDENYSQRCDVWGAGMILYEMLAGKLLFQKVSTFQDLKNEWHLYEIGQRRVQYDSRLHPNWEFLTNYMLTYDPKKRPTFHEVLDKLKKVYDQMLYEIRNKAVKEVNEKTKVGRLELFLQFTVEKYGILARVSEAFTQKVLTIRGDIKYLIEFLCLAHYVCHIKKLIRNLKYKRVSVKEDGEDLIDEEDNNTDLLLDKYRNIFEHKFNFYTDQLTKRIVPKLLEDFGKKPETQPLLKDLKDTWELVSDVSEDTYDVEETYNEHLKMLLKQKLETYHKGLLQKLKAEELAVLQLVYVAALIEQVVDNDNYLKKNFVKDLLAKVESGSREEQLKQINAFQKLIK